MRIIPFPSETTRQPQDCACSISSFENRLPGRPEAPFSPPALFGGPKHRRIYLQPVMLLPMRSGRCHFSSAASARVCWNVIGVLSSGKSPRCDCSAASRRIFSQRNLLCCVISVDCTIVPGRDIGMAKGCNPDLSSLLQDHSTFSRLVSPK